jgi:hypothetical protein
MSAHYVPQPLIRLTVLVTPQQKEALARDAAQTGKAMGQLVRDMFDAKYGNPKVVAGWQVRAEVKRPEDTGDAQPARARLREWVTRSRRSS